MKTILKGAFLGGVLAYLWGIFSWYVIPWHQSAFEQFPNEGFVQWILKENAPVKGVYLIPYPFGDHATPSNKGPLVMATIDPEGGSTKMLGFYLDSFFVQALVAAILTILIRWTKPLSFMKRVFFVMWIGVAMGFVAYLPGVPGWNWWGFSRSYFLIMLCDMAVSMFLMGLGIAYATKNGDKSQ